MDIKEMPKPRVAAAAARVAVTWMHVEKRMKSVAMKQDAPVIAKI